MKIPASIEVILTSINPILEKCVHLQVQYLRVLSQYSWVLKQIWCTILKLVVDLIWNSLLCWFIQKTSPKLLQNGPVLWQYSPMLHLQVITFFKYWLNTCEYYHNTYEYCHNTYEYCHNTYEYCHDLRRLPRHEVGSYGSTVSVWESLEEWLSAT